ncbi:MAG TPA: hypothetical protein VMJ10_09430 [Kofleriaceae bacterium]|nr:hypothetical protein [Kofleriaceae bacterium]
MKTDTPGFLDVKVTVIAKDGEPWLAALAALGEIEHAEAASGWEHRRVKTSAVLRELAIRVLGYVGPPTADMLVGLVGADRLVSDGTTEIPDVSLADVPRVVGPPSKDTLLGALKDTLRGAASK